MGQSDRLFNIKILGMFSIILLGSGIIVELLSIKYLILSYKPYYIHVYLVMHTIGSMLMSLSLPFILKPIKQNNYNLSYFFISLSFHIFIPVLGVLIPIIIYRPKTYDVSSQVIKKTKTLKLKKRKIIDAIPKKININTKHIVLKSSISSIITSNNIAPEDRQKAVLDTIKLQDKDSVPLLRKALKDNDDDVRLLAFALLKKKETIITTRLNNRLQEVNDKNKEASVYLHKLIAYDCWEMIYLELVQGELKKHIIDLAIKHILIVLKHKTDDPGINLLYAKILLKKGDYNKARDYLINARNAGIDINKILPYLAELAFFQKRFTNMSIYIKNIRKDAPSYKVSRMIEVVKDG